MGKDVYANGMEISGKASDNKSICAMPDVCMSPPSPPAGPIPIPYPNTGMTSDTTDGSRDVKIGNQEVGLKNESKYKSSKGDQPATNSFGAGVISHKLGGGVKFAAYSMDVKIESSNAPRFMDLTTHNHMNTGNGALTSSIAGLDIPNPVNVKCEELSKANDAARDDMKSGEHGKGVENVGNANATITHASYGGTIMRACSRAIVHQYDNTWQSGLTNDEKNAKRNSQGKVESGASCGGHVYKEADSRPHTSHTESRIIENIFKANPSGGGTLVMAIDWPGAQQAGKPPGSPCNHCKALICSIATSKPPCLDIKICNPETDVAEPPKCP
jgi:hypothetical protein